MNRILLVSHSIMLAQATKNFCEMMLPHNNDVEIDIVAGNDANELGNSYKKINKSLKHKGFENTFIIYDFGSARMILDVVIEQNKNLSLHIVHCAFVEGAFVAYPLINKNSKPANIVASIEKQAGLKS